MTLSVNIASVGYGILVLLYLGLGLLLLANYRFRLVNQVLVLACIVSIAWASMHALLGAGVFVSGALIYVAELFRLGCWVWLLSLLLFSIDNSKRIYLLSNLLWLALIGAGFFVGTTGGYASTGLTPDQMLAYGGLATALLGLVLTEQLFRNTPPNSRWAIKLLITGVGGLFAYELFLHSMSVLYGATEITNWLARAWVNVLLVPILVLAIRRNPQLNVPLFVSRHVVFYSTTLTAVGAYFVFVSVGGYLISQYGGSWSGLGQVVFFAGAILVLVTLLFSGTIRAKIKVFITKHFYENRYDYREEWIRLVSNLSQFSDSSTREVVIKSLSDIVESPGGVLWLKDTESNVLRFETQYGANESWPDLDSQSDLVQLIQEDEWLIDVDEMRLKPELYRDIVVPEWLENTRLAWLIVPLFSRGELVGLILLLRSAASQALNFEDRDLLKTVGNHIAVHLEQEQSERMLSKAKQFEAYNKLTAFLMHDLNNLVAQQTLIVKNAEKHRRNPDFVDDAIATIANSVSRMQGIMEQLKRGRTERRTEIVPVKFVVSAALDRCAHREPVPSLSIESHASIRVDKTGFTQILVHLINNAQEAVDESGSVSVRLFEQHDSIVIEISDSGVGMSQEFIREKLFEPFESTKGVEGMGIGAFQAREFVRAMGGDLTVSSEPGEGTAISVTLPNQPAPENKLTEDAC